MSTLKVANVHFESTGTNRIDYLNDGIIRMTATNGVLVNGTPISGAAPTKTTSFTFSLSEANLTTIADSASAITATIPTNAAVAYPLGTKLRLYRANTGTVKFVPDTGVTLRLPTGIKPSVFMGCKANRSAATGVNISTDTAVPYAEADTYDTHGFHDTVTNNTRFTIPAGLGIKKVSMNALNYASNLTSGWVMMHFSNSFDSKFYGFTNFDSTVGSFQMSVSAIGIPVSDSSYIQVICRVQTDTSIDFTADTYAILEVTEIDAQGWVAYQYGTVEIEKVATNEWIVTDHSALG